MYYTNGINILTNPLTLCLDYYFCMTKYFILKLLQVNKIERAGEDGLIDSFVLRY